jgi:hypothetical protein
MARPTFFSFHYQRDVWRASIVRNSGVVIGSAAAGFHDKSIWEEAKKKGRATIENMIDAALVGTSVTVVLIGAESSNRQYINYEIDESIKRKNGILGIHIHMIKNKDGLTDYRGAVPSQLIGSKYKVYDWPFDSEKFSAWIEDAYANR